VPKGYVILTEAIHDRAGMDADGAASGGSVGERVEGTNVNADLGYAMTFGLLAVDRETFVRTVKPTARWLGEVAPANALV
jgi:beta-glucosidase